MLVSNNQRSSNLVFTIFLILFAGIIAHLGFGVGQKEFSIILIDFSLLFGIYIILWQKFANSKYALMLGLAIGVRLLLIFSTPALSDDIYRFLWDGYLSAQGINPLAWIPENIIEEPELSKPYLQSIYPLLNSSGYFSVYPPLAQLTFLLAVVFAQSIIGQIICIKILLFGFELATFWMINKLLTHFNLSRSLIFLYALNPLVIIEIMGNTHYEGILYFFLIWGVWLSTRRGGLVYAGLALASSIASKLTSLMYLPLWLRFKGWRWALGFYLIIFVAILFYWMPFISITHINNFGESLNLYFQTFEFNASLYYLARWIGFQMRGYNMIADIGPLLTLIPIATILYLSYRQRPEDAVQLLKHILIAATVYLWCATTVHPWYIIVPLGISIFTSYRYAILWSFVGVWSYSHYQDGMIGVRFGWLWAEYLLLILFMSYEWWSLKKGNMKN